MKVTIVSVPKMQQGGMIKKRVTIVSVPGTHEMAYGGALPVSKGYGYNALDTHWNPDTYQGMAGVDPDPDPYGKVGKTLPEDPNGNVNAEKDEKVLGNFDQSGMPSLMNVGGPPHTQGGKNISVPENSFIFSDTKSLKIKDPDVLKMFNATKPSTPAKLATQYDLQKFTKVLADPKSDNTEKKTAELMVDNYQKKLDLLAQVQEGMKTAKTGGGVPNVGNDNPQMIPGGQQTPMIGSGMQMGGYMQDGGNYTGYDPAAAAKNRYSGDPNTADYQTYLVSRGATDPTGDPISVDDKFGWRTRGAKIPKMNFAHDDDFNPEQEIQRQTSSFPSISPAGPVPLPNNMQDPTIGNNIGTVDLGIGLPDNVKETISSSQLPIQRDPQFTAPTPDKWALENALVNRSLIHRIPAWESPIGAVAPSVVYEDPTRALAANQEASNAAGYDAAISGNNKAARANFLGYQNPGEAANIVAGVNNRNVGIANQASREAAGISNELQKERAARLSRIYQGNAVAQQQYDNALRESNNDVLRQRQTAFNDRSKASFLNATSPYFSYDPTTGARGFKSDEAKAKFENDILRMGNNAGSSSAVGVGGEANKIYQELIKQQMFQGDEGNKAARKLAEEMSGDLQKRRVTTQGLNEIPKTSVTTGIFAGNEQQKYGGPVKHRLGGFTQHQLKKYINKRLGVSA